MSMLRHQTMPPLEHLALVGVRARSVQSNAAVDDQLRAGNVARIL
jgi:hypothetical protein